MRNELKRIVIILTPLVILAVYIGQKMSSDAAAVAIGGFLGLFGGGIFALVAIMLRDSRNQRDREQAAPRRAPAARAIDANWRDVPPPVQPVQRASIEAPSRALAVVEDGKL